MTKKQHWQSSKHQKGMKDEMLRMNRMQYDLVNGQKMNESDSLVRQVYEIEYRLYKQPIRIEHHHPFDCQVSIVRIHSSECYILEGWKYNTVKIGMYTQIQMLVRLCITI